MLHALTSGLAVGMFFAMGGAMLYEFDRMGVGPLGYGLFFAMTSIGYILGNFINDLLVGRVDVFKAVVFMFLFWCLQRACHCECNDL